MFQFILKPGFRLKEMGMTEGSRNIDLSGRVATTVPLFFSPRISHWAAHHNHQEDLLKTLMTEPHHKPTKSGSQGVGLSKR